MRSRLAYVSCVALAVVAASAGAGQAADVPAPDEPMSVWFDRPGRTFHESCVLGNGRLGAMDLGGVSRDRIVLNESSLWSGGPYDGNNYGAYKCLPEVREKLLAASGGIRGAGAAKRAVGGKPETRGAGLPADLPASFSRSTQTEGCL